MNAAAKRLSITALCLMSGSSAFSYEVWMGAPYIPKDAAEKIDLWNLSAKGAKGFNANLGDGKRPAADQNTDETWAATMSKYQNGWFNGMKPFPRSTYDWEGMPADRDHVSLDDQLTKFFIREKKYGIKLGSIALYNNAIEDDSDDVGVPYSDADIDEIRAWLDNPANGDHADVKLYFNVRALTDASKARMVNPKIDGIMLEAIPKKWFGNSGQRQELLKWLAFEEPRTFKKEIVFQLPVHHIDDSLSVYQEVRRWLRWISSEDMLGSHDFIRRDTVAIMPMVYNFSVPFYPEMTGDKTAYKDTQTGLALSLMEQKNLFEGRVPEGLISTRAAESFERSAWQPQAPFIEGDKDIKIVKNHDYQLPLSLWDDYTPVREVTLIARSSDTALIPNRNLVIEGQGANRTLTLTPATGATGTTTISLITSDGTMSRTKTFKCVVAEIQTLDAQQSGNLNQDATWGRRAPVEGDIDIWNTGAFTVNLDGLESKSELTFHGNKLLIPAGGALLSEATSATLIMNNLVLKGGTIKNNKNGDFNIDLSGNTLALQGGTIRSGTSSNSRDVRFSNARVAGSGTIVIEASEDDGSEVDFTSSLNMTRFRGTFQVDSGLLNLPAIAQDKASFGLILNGTGSYVNDANIAVTSLEIAGEKLPNGTYSHSDFSAKQRQYIKNNGGRITVTNAR